MASDQNNALNQELDVRGSINHDPYMELSDELLHLGARIQNGASASITLSSGIVTVSGLAGFSDESLNRYLTISGAANANNNGTFLIIEFISATSVIISNSSGVTDANNGSILWIERKPYSLEDDINYIRTDRANIKEVVGVDSGQTDLSTDLTNQSAFYPFDDLPDATPTVVEALNTLNEQIGDRTYTGSILTSGTTITEALQDLADGASGISANAHAALRQLIHLADGNGPFEQFASGAYREIAGGIFPTSVIWWESSAKLEKIVEKTITRNADQTPAIIEWKAYDTDGVTVLATATDTVSYSGITETSRTRVIA